MVQKVDTNAAHPSDGGKSPPLHPAALRMGHGREEGKGEMGGVTVDFY